MTQALTVRETSLEETMQLGDLLAKSGFFADSKGAAQAVVKVLAGREIGFGPIASMTGIHVIQGRVSLSANLIAAAIKRSGKYDYTVTKMDNAEVVIMFWQRHPKTGEYVEIGESKFTANDAKAAGTQNMAKYARNMLFARAMSNGAKWYTPDIFGGPVYTPDELGVQVDGETGEVIDAPAPRIVVERQAEATNGNQHKQQEAEPPGFATWADWQSPSDAIQWGLSQGVFEAQKHAEHAYAKVKTECKPANAKAMWECWYQDVQRRLAELAAKPQPQLTDAELDGDDEPQFS